MAQTTRSISLGSRRLVVIAAIMLAARVQAQEVCVGDCDQNGVVAVNELVSMVNIALERALVALCLAGDTNGDGKIVVNEVVAGVGALLRGCVAPPTPTPTPTPTATATPTTTPTATPTATPTFTGPTDTPTPTVPTGTPTETPTGPTATATRTPTATRTGMTPTHTGTPSNTSPPMPTFTSAPTSTRTSVPTATSTQPPTATATTSAPTPASGALGIASRLPMVLRAATVFPIVSTVMSRAGLNGGPAAGESAGEAGPCPLGGTALRTDGPDFEVLWQATNCKLPAYGGALTVDGTIRAFNEGEPPTQRIDVNVSGTYANSGGDPVLMGEIEISGMNQSPVAGGRCQTRGIFATESAGRIRATTPDQRWAQIAFTSTNAGYAFSSNSADEHCVPSSYSVNLSGPAMVSSSAGGAADVTFNQLSIMANDSTSVTKFTALFGGITSNCIGGAIQITQPVQAELGWSSVCPTAGEMVANFGNDVRSYLTYSPDRVDFDIGFNTSIDVSADDCWDTRFLACP